MRQFAALSWQGSTFSVAFLGRSLVLVNLKTLQMKECVYESNN
jgi:hypothetical protein